MDRTTEEHRRLILRFIGYWWYLQESCLSDSRNGRPRVSMLFVTTGERRLLNLMETLRQMRKPNRATHGGKELFLFSSAADIRLEDPTSIAGPIWRTPNAPPRSLELH